MHRKRSSVLEKKDWFLIWIAGACSSARPSLEDKTNKVNHKRQSSDSSGDKESKKEEKSDDKE